MFPISPPSGLNEKDDVLMLLMLHLSRKVWPAGRVLIAPRPATFSMVTFTTDLHTILPNTESRQENNPYLEENYLAFIR